MTPWRRMFTFTLLSSLLTAVPLSAAELRQFELQLQRHLFTPSTLYLPAGEKVKIRLVNLDHSPEEFESFKLNCEKVVLGQSEASIFIGPLKPGEYPFNGEYNPDTAQGVIIALPLEEFNRLPVGGTHADLCGHRLVA